MKQNYDVIIIGAGPVGLAFAASLKNTKLNVLILEKLELEAIKNPKDDGREIALTHASVEILSALGVWQLFTKDDITSIKKAQVFNNTDNKPLEFSASQSKLNALGYLVANYRIRQNLYQLVSKQENAEIMTQATIKSISINTNSRQLILDNDISINTKLLVAADSRFSRVRQDLGIATQMRDFSKIMIVCRMQHTQPHYNIAYEYFFAKNTLALLPLNDNNASVVITLKKSEAEQVLALSEEDFNQFVNTQFIQPLGTMSLISERFSYPLVGIIADSFIAKRCALIGDAAVGMHPVTAHGFNLGLRGMAILAEQMKGHNIDIGGWFVLRAYQAKQRNLARLMYFGTNGVVELFASDDPKLALVRKFALKFARKFPPIHYAINKHLTQSNQRFYGSILS